MQIKFRARSGLDDLSTQPPSFCGLIRCSDSRWLIRLSMSNVHHETVFYSGHVQGVGFRYATMEVAREFDVSGYVKNLADGRVQVEAEGSAKEIAAFLAALEERMHGFVRKSERSSENRPPQFSGFTIR